MDSICEWFLISESLHEIIVRSRGIKREILTQKNALGCQVQWHIDTIEGKRNEFEILIGTG